VLVEAEDELLNFLHFSFEFLLLLEHLLDEMVSLGSKEN
jgi:hypothetical protein